MMYIQAEPEVVDVLLSLQNKKCKSNSTTKSLNLNMESQHFPTINLQQKRIQMLTETFMFLVTVINDLLLSTKSVSFVYLGNNLGSYQSSNKKEKAIITQLILVMWSAQ